MQLLPHVLQFILRVYRVGGGSERQDRLGGSWFDDRLLQTLIPDVFITGRLYTKKFSHLRSLLGLGLGLGLGLIYGEEDMRLVQTTC